MDKAFYMVYKVKHCTNLNTLNCTDEKAQVSQNNSGNEKAINYHTIFETTAMLPTQLSKE